MSTILEIRNLSVTFQQGSSSVEAVKNVSIILKKGQCLGVVGESGSGKSVTSLSILDLLKYTGSPEIDGQIVFFDEGQQKLINELSEESIRSIRGNDIAMVFQEPMSSLNPVMRCGRQIEEVLKVHKIVDKSQCKSRTTELLSKVQLTDVDRVYRSYPHELSGGQLQRVNIAMALAGRPKILICDEPTTALDVTVQKEIIELLRSLIQVGDMAMIFVCHDLDLVAELCDSVVVMNQGEVVESGPLPQVFDSPQHLYTKALLQCKPTTSLKDFILPTVNEIIGGNDQLKKRAKSTLSKESILRVNNLVVDFPTNSFNLLRKTRYLRAVDQVSFELNKGEVLGIVGESGSGKSTVANCISGLIDPTSGYMTYQGAQLNQSNLKSNKMLRRSVQLIFQDPYSSLNPRMTIGNCIAEPIAYHKLEKNSEGIRSKTLQLLSQVGLPEEYFDRYPHELSGGERQRVCIARAISVKPQLLICDECVSALDVSVQAQILNLLDQLKSKLNLSILFISHDLSVVHYISDRVAVMQSGRIVELDTADEIINNPKQAYTKRLIDSIPGRDKGI